MVQRRLYVETSPIRLASKNTCPRVAKFSLRDDGRMLLEKTPSANANCLRMGVLNRLRRGIDGVGDIRRLIIE